MIDYELALKALTAAGIVSGIFYRVVWIPFTKKQEEKINIALAAQRNEFQAGYFDLQEKRYTALVRCYVNLSKEVEGLKHALKNRDN
jgi:uncharacterized protein YfbU (UPF0304 family)